MFTDVYYSYAVRCCVNVMWCSW